MHWPATPTPPLPRHTWQKRKALSSFLFPLMEQLILDYRSRGTAADHTRKKLDEHSITYFSIVRM
jgi:hypothetical protein